MEFAVTEFPEAASPENSCLGPALRAESAANGEAKVGRDGATGSVRRSSVTDGTIDGRAVVLVPDGEGCTSLNSCSIGNNRCACDIFNSPSSR
jgi:hypothetical protein